MVELVVVNPLEPGGSSKAWMWASFNIFHVSSARTLSFTVDHCYWLPDYIRLLCDGPETFLVRGVNVHMPGWFFPTPCLTMDWGSQAYVSSVQILLN
jgi:hypothetical protein